MAGRDIDLRSAINANSDVIQDRPRPIRTLDQIYMKAGDMVLQSELVAKWADNERLAFIGDGDAIKFRDECLNEHWFVTLAQARAIIGAWRRDYNEFRPHSSLGDLAPAEFAARCRASLLGNAWH